MSQQAATRFKQTLLLLLVGGAVACAPKNPPRGPIVLENDHEIRPATPAPQQAVDIPRTRTGTISRDKLHSVLDAGVGGFLTQLEVEAYFEERSFWGWKVQRYDNIWVDLLPGDIITSINGKRIETPAQVQALWQSLRNTEEIVVAAYRHENPFELRFTVQGAASASTP
jgi:S1-C subfamily serine protease